MRMPPVAVSRVPFVTFRWQIQASLALCGLLMLLASGCGRSANQYIARGNQLFDSGKYADAIINYRNAIKRDPKSGEAHYRLALALLRSNDAREAYQALTTAVQLSPGNIAAKSDLADLSLAVYAQSPNHPAAFYDRAAKIADELLAANPNSLEGLKLKGAIALIDNHPGQAVEAFRNAARFSSGSPQVQTALAEALFRDNQPEQGEREARSVITNHPDYGPVYDLLYTQYILSKRWDDAEALLKLRMAKNPKDATAVMRLAGFYAGRQKRDDAEKIIDSMLAQRNDFPQADLLAGDFHVLTRSFDKALQDYQRGLSRDQPREQLYQVRSAATLAVLGRREEALKTLDAVLSKDPKDPNARALQISTWLQNGGADDLKKAADQSNTLAQDQPGNPRLQMLTGQTALAARQYSAAISRFQQAARLVPNSVAPHLGMSRAYHLNKDYPAMLEQANAALAINGRDENARLYRVMALTATGAFAAAKTEAEQLARDTSNARQVQMQLGIIALSQKRYAQAEEYFQKLYQQNQQDISPLAGLVSTLVAEKNPDRALTILAAQEKRAPESLATEALTAATAQASGKTDVAIAELQKMAIQAPKSADVQVRLGDLERKQGNFTAAIQSYERAHQLEPKRRGINAAIGSAQDSLGDKAAAIQSYRKALAETPNNAFVLNNLAYLLVESGGDLNEANRLVTNGLRTAPNNPSLEDTLGWVEIHQGNTAAALQLFSSLTRENPDNVMFRYHYAVALFRSGNHAAAKRECGTALAKQPPPDVAKDIRSLLAQAN